MVVPDGEDQLGARSARSGATGMGRLLPFAGRVAALLSRWVALVVAIALMIAFSASRVLHLASADTLLPVLMSTDRLTWFYWGQDRLANLVPLLAASVQAPRANFGLQMVIVAAGWYGLIAVFVGHHVRTRGLRVGPPTIAVATVASGLVAAWVLRAATEQTFVFEQLYALATLLLVGGVLALLNARRVWQVCGAVVVLAAALVNPAIVLCVPLVVAACPAVRWRAVARAAVVAAGALVLTTVASAAFGADANGGAYSDFSLRRARSNIRLALRRVEFAADFDRARPVLLLATLLLLLLWSLRARGGRRVVATAVMVTGFGFAWTVLFSGNLWVEQNQLNSRYFFPLFAAGLFLVASAMAEAAAMLVSLIRRWLPARGRDRRGSRAVLDAVRLGRAAVALAALPIAVVVVARVDVDVLVAAEPVVTRLDEGEIEFVAGSYWDVWPTVVEARAQGLTMWGIAPRMEAIRSQLNAAMMAEIRERGSARIACVGMDAQGCAAWVHYWTALPLTFVSEAPFDPLVIIVR